MYVRVLQRNRTIIQYVCVCVCVCVYAHLAYTIMEAEKSQDLVSAIWTYVLIYVF